MESAHGFYSADRDEFFYSLNSVSSRNMQLQKSKPHRDDFFIRIGIDLLLCYRFAAFLLLQRLAVFFLLFCRR